VKLEAVKLSEWSESQLTTQDVDLSQKDTNCEPAIRPNHANLSHSSQTLDFQWDWPPQELGALTRKDAGTTAIDAKATTTTVTPKFPWRPLPTTPAQRLQQFQKYYMALLSPAMQAEDPAASTLRRRTNIDRLNVSKPRASLLGMAERVRHTILERLFPTGKVRVRVLSLMSKRRPLSTRYRIPLKAPPRCDSGEHVKSDAPATTYYAVIVRETKRKFNSMDPLFFVSVKRCERTSEKYSTLAGPSISRAAHRPPVHFCTIALALCDT